MSRGGFGNRLAPALADIAADAPPERGRKGKQPTSRSLEKLRDEGWFVEKVEQRLSIPGSFVTRDLFGFGDIFAVNESLGILLVQTTSGDNVSKRLRKMEEDPEILVRLIACLKVGILVHVHGWAMRGLRGERKRWTCRIVEARLGAGGSLEWAEETPE